MATRMVLPMVMLSLQRMTMASLKPVDVVVVVVDSGVESVAMAITEVGSVVENAAVSEAAIVAGTVVDSVEVIAEVIAEATVEVTVEASCYPHSLCSNILILTLLGFRGGRGGGEWRGDGERGRGGRGRGRGDRGGETGLWLSSFFPSCSHNLSRPSPTSYPYSINPDPSRYIS